MTRHSCHPGVSLAWKLSEQAQQPSSTQSSTLAWVLGVSTRARYASRYVIPSPYLYLDEKTMKKLRIPVTPKMRV
jgi:hypothetical protein